MQKLQSSTSTSTRTALKTYFVRFERVLHPRKSKAMATLGQKILTFASKILKTEAMHWWKRNPIYQIYPRSFKDANGDGVGDIKGIIEKVDYFEWLGIKTVWISPIFKSPMVDFGYDISDYRDIDPLFGNMEDFKEMVKVLHKKGIRLVLDFVPNHTSDHHPWFQDSKHGKDPYTDYYVWRDGQIDEKTKERKPPNTVMSVFGGPAWTWNEERQKWYLHHFLPEQPDLNFSNPSVRQEMKDVLKFWVDQGVDGFRIDAVTFIGKEKKHTDDEAPPTEVLQEQKPSAEKKETFEVHGLPLASYEIIGEWRQFLTDTFGEPEDGKMAKHVFLCTEGYTELDNVIRFYDHGVDFPFNFSLVNWTKKSTAKDLRRWVTEWMKRMSQSEKHTSGSKRRHTESKTDGEEVQKRWPNWVAGNHDQSRPATRLGGSKYADVINTLLLTLPGTPTVYQGDELGMEDVPVTFDQCQDPYGKRFGPDHFSKYTRDPCRSPMIWHCDKKNGGFSSAGDTVGPWLPLHEDKSLFSIDIQMKDPKSHLNFFRRLLKLRDTEPVFHAHGHNIRLLVNDDEEELFAFERWMPNDGGQSDFVIILNVGHDPEDKMASVDLSPEMDTCNRRAEIVIKSCADDERGYEEGKEIDLSSIKMKPAEVLIVKLEVIEQDGEIVKKRKVQ